MNIPKPNDKLDWSPLIIGNYAGRGSREGTYGRSRSLDAVDAAARFHDFLYYANGLSHAESPYDNDPIKKSRLAKSNYIFWLLVNKAKEKTIRKVIISVVGNQILPYDKKDFRKDDGFQNVLTAESIQSPEYLMIPFQKLSQKSQDKLTKVIYDDSFDGVGASGGGKKWIYDFNTAVEEDFFDFRTWFEEYFAEAWTEAFAVE